MCKFLFTCICISLQNKEKADIKRTINPYILERRQKKGDIERDRGRKGGSVRNREEDWQIFMTDNKTY